MVLCPFLIGYYVRHARRLTIGRAVIIAGAFVVLFLTHLVAATLAILVVMVLAVWIHILTPLLLPVGNRPGFGAVRPGVRQAGLVLVALVPTIALFILFARSATDRVQFTPGVLDAWYRFPMHVFTTADGFSGNQIYLWPAVLSYIVLGITAMRRSEWQSARGGLALAIVAAFVLYLLVPESGLGGNQVKIRFAWGVFILGGLIACSVRRLRPLRAPIALYVAAFLVGNLISTIRGVSAYSLAVEDYLSTVEGLPRGARFVRLRYQTPDLPQRYGFYEISRDPLFHLDAYVAARCHCIDLSDYQAPNNIFPIIFKPSFERGQQYGLWGFEGPGETTSEALVWLRASLPIPIDYVILVLDESSPGGTDLPKVLANLNTGMRVIATSRPVPFVHLYQRTGAR